MRKCKFNRPEYREVFKNSPAGNYKVYSHMDSIDHWSNGFFHGWGFDYTEFDSGPGNFSIGIVEDESGQCYKISPSNIVFEITKPEENNR